MADADVVVVGFGAGAIAAAITAHDAGAHVVMLEKASADRAGGNSRASSGVWICPHDVELAKVYFDELTGEYPVPAPIVEAWASETAQNTAWVRARLEEARGVVERDAADPYDVDGTDVTSLSHGAVMRGLGWADAPEHEFPEVRGSECGTEFNWIGPQMGFSRLWHTLKACVAQRGIEVRFASRATALVTDEDGAVSGVVVTPAEGDPYTLTAGTGVILATGGFAANPEMARTYLRLPSVVPWGSPSNTGDGIRLAQKVGADLAHPYNYMGYPGIALPGHATGEQAMPAGPGFVMVAADGRRFIDESVVSRHGKAWLRGGFDFFPGFPMWTVFDERTRLAGPLCPPRELYAGGWLTQVERYDWSADNGAEIEAGWIARADTLAELAQQLGIDPAGLEAKVAAYNAACRDGGDVDPPRPAAARAPLDQPPYYGYAWGPLLITTLGGIRKDELGRALDPEGQPIDGLYCAGDVASSYSWALGGGSGLGDAMAFGRIAARHAVQTRGAAAGAAVS